MRSSSSAWATSSRRSTTTHASFPRRSTSRSRAATSAAAGARRPAPAATADDLAEGLAAELARLQPAEVLLPRGPDGEPPAELLALLPDGARPTPRPAELFRPEAARRAVLEHFR